MKCFGLLLALLGLMVAGGCAEGSADKPFSTESLPEATAEIANQTPDQVTEICLAESEGTDNLYPWDIGIDLFIDKVALRESDLQSLFLDGAELGNFYSREDLAKKDDYPLERLEYLRALGLQQEWRQGVQVYYEQVRRLSNDDPAVNLAFAQLAAPNSSVLPNLKIEVQIDFFNSVECARQYFESEIVADRMETQTLANFGTEISSHEESWPGGGIVQNALVVPSSSFSTLITVTSTYEAPDYLDQALDTIKATGGEDELVAYFESLDQSGAGYIDTPDLLEMIANRYWQQAR